MAGAKSDDAIEPMDTETQMDVSIKQTSSDKKALSDPGPSHAHGSHGCAVKQDTEGCTDGCCGTRDERSVREERSSLSSEAGLTSEGCCADGETCDGKPANPHMAGSLTLRREVHNDCCSCRVSACMREAGQGW